MFVAGTSLIPSHGNQTQNIPPITSVKDNKVKSAAGIFFEPIEYNIKPAQTKVPWVANKASFLLEDKNWLSFKINITDENKKQNKPAIATVVNLGVSFLQRKVTEKTENPRADAKPKTRPGREFVPPVPNAITTIPNVATKIATQTVSEIFSLKNKNPNNAVINGIAAKHKSVTAALVFVIDHIKVIIAVPNPMPPKTPEIPTLK